MSLDDTICSVMNGELEFDAISEYCQMMPVTEEAFSELRNAVEAYDLSELYTELFTRFNVFLSKQDLRYFTDKCRSVFDETVCELLICGVKTEV